jgi:hypothetical protein
MAGMQQRDALAKRHFTGKSSRLRKLIYAAVDQQSSVVELTH